MEKATELLRGSGEGAAGAAGRDHVVPERGGAAGPGGGGAKAQAATPTGRQGAPDPSVKSGLAGGGGREQSERGSRVRGRARAPGGQV